jgi:hypothetical protein
VRQGDLFRGADPSTGTTSSYALAVVPSSPPQTVRVAPTKPATATEPAPRVLDLSPSRLRATLDDIRAQLVATVGANESALDACAVIWREDGTRLVYPGVWSHGTPFLFANAGQARRTMRAFPEMFKGAHVG